MLILKVAFSASCMVAKGKKKNTAPLTVTRWVQTAVTRAVSWSRVTERLWAAVSQVVLTANSRSKGPQ